MKKCETCGNIIRLPDGSCEYCVWKGNIGPGHELKEIIKKERTAEKEHYEDTIDRRPT